MADKHAHSGAVSFYIVIALILGAITYVEYAIVEYDLPWLPSFWVLALLIVLSLVKFALVVALYMHLRDDDRLYTGFFSSGMVFALGTFVALSFLFTVRSKAPEFRDVRATLPSAVQMTGHDSVHGDSHATGQPGSLADAPHGASVALAERPLSERYRAPAPKRQGLGIVLPASAPAQYSLVSGGSVLPPAEQPAPGELLAQTEPGDFDWQELGESTYAAQCAACHQATGQGVPGAFPPLAGHMPELYNAQGGRDYLIHVVLHGLQGPIEVNGTTYNGVMPPFGQLSDEQVAATLNHELSSWGNLEHLQDFSPITPEEVAALRNEPRTAAEVLELRP